MAAEGVDGKVVIDISADSSEFNQALSQISRDAQNLNDATIRVNANTSDAQTQIDNIRRTLSTLPDGTVRVNADITQYQEQIRQLQEEVRRLQEQVDNGAEDTQKKFTDLAKKIAGIVSAGAVAKLFTDMGKAAVESYASYEQLVGGVDTLFKESSEKVQEYAAEAYKNVGISANQYMEQVTSFSASLLQSLGGDTNKAADIANQAMIDMADNANKMGTSMESIQTAYQGFAKQNYTMLDNLKLGYGGTKQEMERLIDDVNRYRAANGEAANLTIDSYADVITAIHEVQEQLDITGTTEREAMSTIEGSAKAAEAAWQNLLTGLADPTQDLSKLIDEFIEAKTTQIENLLPVVEHTIEGIGKAIDQLIPELDGAGEELAKLLTEDAIPALIDALKWLVNNKELVAAAIKGFVTAEAIKGFTTLGGAVGGTLTNINKLTGSATTASAGLSNLVKSLLATTTATEGATAASTAFGLSLGAWGLIITGVTALALGLAAALNEAANEAERMSKYQDGFTDASNDVLARYAEITSGKNTQSADELKKQLDEDKKALDDAVDARQQYADELKQVEERIQNSVYDPEAENRRDELNDLIEQKDREIQVYTNTIHQEEKLYEERSKVVDQELTGVEQRTATHIQRINDLYEQEEHFELGSQEHLESFENQWDKISHWDKENFDRYWDEKRAWLEEHKVNEEWWWNEYHKVEEHYQKKADAEERERQKQEQEEQRKREQEQRRQEQERRKQEQEAARQEREHLNALKNAKEKAYRDIDANSYTLPFANNLEKEKYILDEQFRWLTEHQSELTEELFDKYYTDWLKANDNYQNKVEQQTQKDQQQLEKIVTKLTNDAKSNVKKDISEVENAFKDIVNAYNKGYDDLLKKRDAYKQKLMGGSVFEVLKKTDEKTGKEYTQYTVNDLSKRYKQQEEFAKDMLALKERGLEGGLAKELLEMDVKDAAVFAEQLSKMSDEDFKQLNERYKSMDETTTRLANEYYKEELDKLQNGFISQSVLFFTGWNEDLKELGGEGFKSYLQGFNFGWENAKAEDLSVMFDPIVRGIDEGSVDLSNVVAKSLDNIDLGEKTDLIIDTIVAAIQAREGDVKNSLLELFDVDDIDWLIGADMQARAGRQSAGGYTAADNTTQRVTQSNNNTTIQTTTAAPTAGAATATQARPKQETLTINANLKLTDGGKRVIAEIVNEENKRIQIGAGK